MAISPVPPQSEDRRENWWTPQENLSVSGQGGDRALTPSWFWVHGDLRTHPSRNDAPPLLWWGGHPGLWRSCHYVHRTNVTLQVDWMSAKQLTLHTKYVKHRISILIPFETKL